MREEKDPKRASRVYRLDHGGKTVGCVVVDSAIGGHAGGGLRIVSRVREDPLRRASYAMTLKYGLLGLPQGGAKAAVLGDPEGPVAERLQALTGFASGFHRLLAGRTYSPAADAGTDERLIRTALTQAGLRCRRRELQGVSSGLYTAHSLLAGARKAARHLGLNWPACTAAVEGFGKVGASLAVLLQQEGVRVVGISTRRGALLNPSGLDSKRLLRVQRAGGEAALQREEGDPEGPGSLLRLPVDVLFPCADAGTVHERTASEVRARILCPGANNALAPGAEEVLLDRGVFCLPGFLVNAGGVIGGTMEYAGVNPVRIAAFVERNLGALAAWFMEESSARKVPIRGLAESYALRRFRRMEDSGEHPTARARVFSVGLEAHRRGIIPRAVAGLLAPAWFRRRLRGL